MTINAKLSETTAITMYDDTPGTTPSVAAYVDLSGYTTFLVAVMAHTLTGVGVDDFDIVAATDDSGTGITVIKTHALGTAPDAAGDWVFLECNVNDVIALGQSLRYVAGRVGCANAADEVAIVYVRSGARYQQAGLTADVIS